MEKARKTLTKRDKAMLRFNPGMKQAIRKDLLDDKSLRWMEGSVTDSFYVRYQN